MGEYYEILLMPCFTTQYTLPLKKRAWIDSFKMYNSLTNC